MVRKILLFKQAKSNIPAFISVIKLPDLLLVLINCTETNGAKLKKKISILLFFLFFFLFFEPCLTDWSRSEMFLM